METKDKEKVSQALSETPISIKIGKTSFKARPLTLSQIYEMGAIANEINAEGLEEKKEVRIIAELIEHYKDAKIMQEVFIVCLFRSRWKRRMFGWYVRRKLTIRIFQQLMTYISQTFDASFFLTSLIFLRQTKMMTEPNPTTARGLSSEE